MAQTSHNSYKNLLSSPYSDSEVNEIDGCPILLFGTALILCIITGTVINLLQALVRANQFTSIDMNSGMTGYTI